MISCPKCGSIKNRIEHAAQWDKIICSECKYYITWIMPKEIVVCMNCGSVDDYRTELSGPHIKAICNGCGRYIKFLLKWKHIPVPPAPAEETIPQQLIINTQPITQTIKTNNMSQGYYGSICIEDLFQNKIAKGSNGKHYVCLEDLTTEPFKKGKTNGKTYAGIGIWINDDIDEFGNIAGISLSQSLQEREQKAKKNYIGNLRRSGEGIAKAATPTPPAQASGPQAAVYNDLPF